MVTQREKKTKSGRLLEVDFYPVFANSGYRVPESKKRSTKQQAEYNKRQAEKKLIRKINSNFDETDYFMHPTYSPENAPLSEKAAKNDMGNYIKRVKYHRKKALKATEKEIAEVKKTLQKLPKSEYLKNSLQKLLDKKKKLSEPLKYVYVIETQVYKSGRYAGLLNFHFHLFITGGLTDREMEKLWTDGVRVNCNNFQPSSFGPEAAAKYISKDPKGSKRFVTSKNLKDPKETSRDGKISRRGVEKLSRERANDREYWEKRHKGYRFIRSYPRYNEYNGYWYLSVVMYAEERRQK